MPILTVEADDQSRTDLVRRSEVKFMFPAADLVKLQRLLEINCCRVVHSSCISMVRSIYLDDAVLSACRANLDGLGVRNKLRLRWYDSLRPDRNLVAEVKWRQGRVTGKHRFHIRCTENVGCLSYRQLIGRLTEMLPEPAGTWLALNSEPIVLVEYSRQHFVSADRRFRLTIDGNLTFYGQFGKKSICTDFPQRLNDIIIVEGKGPVGEEDGLRELLHPFAPRVSKFSKYVHGCYMTGLISSVS